MKKRIVLCADDYGQAPEISQAIITLIQYGRLSATSCMVNSPFWQEHAKWLQPYKGQIDIGLHFNLTEGEPLSKPFSLLYGNQGIPLSQLLRKALLRRLDKASIVAECHAQLDYFEDALGFKPRYIDGHQHVHQFPVVREAMLEVYEERLHEKQAYIRLPAVNIQMSDYFKNPKKVMIYLSGTKGLRHLLQANDIPYNQTFAGIYAFSEARNYPNIFLNFLRDIGNGGIIMCHPGLAPGNKNDSIAQARPHEYRYFFSGQFLEDCVDHGVMIKRFS